MAASTGQARCEEHELAALFVQPSVQQPHELIRLVQQRAPGAEKPAQSAGQLIVAAGFAWITSDLAVVVEAAHQSGAVCLIAYPGQGDGNIRFDTTLLDRLHIAMYREYAHTHGLLTSSGLAREKADQVPGRVEPCPVRTPWHTHP